MNSELHSLPEALTAELRQLASEAIPQKPESQGIIPVQDAKTRTPNAVHSALLEIAKSTPELFAALITASLGYDGIAVTETRTTTRDEVVKLRDGSFSSTAVRPMSTTETIHREVRLSRPPRELRQ